MPRMIDLIRASAVPATLVHSAARGALALPPAEMIEILVYLANHNKIFGQQARMTLAGWEEKSSLAAAADPKTPVEVLEYLVSPDNLRPVLLPALLENPSVPEQALVALGATGSREVIQALLASDRVKQSTAVRVALENNPNHAVPPAIVGTADDSAPTSELVSTTALKGDGGQQVLAPVPEAAEPESPATVDDEEVSAFLAEHAAEIEAEKDKPFQPLGGLGNELEALEPAAPVADSIPSEEATPAIVAAAAPAPSVGPGSSSDSNSSAVPAPIAKHGARPHEGETKRGSALQKISKMDIKGRIQLAMKGTKEERSILIRDGTKIVALAVLESPKITDGEVEAFASQKNVLEAVLRAIPMKRRYAKHYPVIRNLVFNPRTPMDVALGLMKNMLVADLKNLSSNKQVSETVRKLALKMFKQKMDSSKKKGD
jgi:hypothetical protein